MAKKLTNNKFDGKKAATNTKPEKKFQKKEIKKPTFVKVAADLAYSDFYADCIDTLYDLLDAISFDKVAIPIKMNKAEFTGNNDLKGSMIVGTISKFNSDNTFTISMSDDYAEKITDDMVVGVRCRKDFNNNAITYISEFTLTARYESIKNHESDLAEAFEGAVDVIDDEEDTTEQ